MVERASEDLTHNIYYAQSYTRFEASVYLTSCQRFLSP